jgi:FdhD protein
MRGNISSGLKTLLPLTAEGGACRLPSLAYRNGVSSRSIRSVPIEMPVSLSFNGTSHAVMLASPRDLEDFALGFAITQRIVDSIEEIEAIEIGTVEGGMDCRLWIAAHRAEKLSERRRALAGPTGCGVCGVEGIADALSPAPHVSISQRPSPPMIMAAMASLAPAQKLGHETRAVHAAGYWEPENGLIAIREDVGRHNALDKLAGALARSPRHCKEVSKDRPGIILLTSRVSVEMVQKTALIGASVLVAVSAPTSLAITMAEEAGIMLIGVARADGFEIFTFPERLQEDAAHSAA